MLNDKLYKLFKKQILLQIFKNGRRVYETNDRIFYDAFRYIKKFDGYKIKYSIW